jgi:type I restriction enzyme M protein
MVLDDRNEVYIPEAEYDKLARSHIFQGDVLITIVGANTGQTALVDEAPDKLTANCKLGILRPKKGAIPPAYLHAFLAGRYGQAQIMAAKRGGGQTGLILPDLKALTVPRLSATLESEIARASLRAHRQRRTVYQYFEEAECSLLRALGLESWEAPEPLSYIRTSSEVFAADRLDAQHFQPRFKVLTDHINASGYGAQLGEWLSEIQRGKQPDYSLEGLPVVNSKHVLRGEVRLEADNRRAAYRDVDLLIQTGDVLMNGTGVGTIGRAAAYLHGAKAIPDNHVTILRPRKELDAVYLSVFLNSIAGQWQVEQRLRGSSGQIELYPNDISKFRVCVAPLHVQREIRLAVEKGFEQKQRATLLLVAVRRAVEVAIEESESSALAVLESCK